MIRLRVLLAAIAIFTAVAFGGASATAQDNPYASFCVQLEAQQAQLDAQVVQFETSIAASRAQIDALDAVLGPAFDATFAAYRVYLDGAEVSYTAQVAAAQAQIDAGVEAYGCEPT